MFITKAWAAADAAAPQITEAATAMANVPPSPAESFMQTMLFTVVLVVLFYFLLIRPQQKRFKEHNAMLNQLAKGEKIVTQGGLVGVIEDIKSDHEMLVDFGNNVKMSVLRSSVLGRYNDQVKTTTTKA
jgi:preprotein translocase subunit YajC